jgi:hypothetical protein
MTTIKQPYFVIYGCWNQPCRDKKEVEDYLHVIAEVIKTKEEQNGLQFVAIAGDNYYPQKIKEKKKNLKVNHVLVPVLEKGVNALKQYTVNDIPVYINYGNHDMVPSSVLTIRKESCVNKLTVNDTTDNVDKIDKPNCYIKATQNKLIKEINSENNTNIHIDFYHTLPTHNFKNTLAFMIDTTLFYNGEYDKKCYKPLMVENVKEIQVRKIQYRIRSSPTKQNIIIIGHHPLISKKYKEKTETDKSKSYKNEKDDGIHKATPAFIDFFKLLQKSVEGKNIYYLCADTHLYQEGTVTLKFRDDSSMIIQQYIAGTGGTKLDEAPTDGVNTLIDIPITDKKIDNQITDKIDYKINKTIANYGFLKVTETDEKGLSFDFINVDANSSSSSSSSSSPPPLGGTRKRRVKKRRTRKKKSRTKSKKREKKLI